jgi:hypothetical protein
MEGKMNKKRVIILLLVVLNTLLLVYTLRLPKQEPKVKETIETHVSTINAIDQTEALEHPDFIKEEYVATIPEGENIALGKKATSNSFTESYTARKVTDGIATGVSYWEGKPKSYPNIITVDLEEVYLIHTIRICLSPMSIWSKRTQDFSVSISDDNETFTEIVPNKQYTFDPDRGNEVQIKLDNIETRYVQLTVTANSGAAAGQIAEFEVYH